MPKASRLSQRQKMLPLVAGDRFAFIHDNERMLVELFQPA